MNRNKWMTSLVGVALLGATAACDADLTEINENPNNPEVVPVATVLASGIWDLVNNSANRGVFGGWTTLYHVSTWAQHSTQAAYEDESNYTPREGVNENIWAEMYAGALQDLKTAQNLAVEAGDQNLVAVTDIMLVYGFLFLADQFGDVPYFQALDVEQYPQPEFTPQQEIYPDLLRRLETAAAQITPGASVGWASGDLVYGGNLDRWQEFANSMRMRVAMRMSNTELASTAATEFQEAWNANRIDSNADIASVNWTGNLPSVAPAYNQIILGGRTGDFRASATVADLLIATNDPRLPVYLQPAVSDGAYRGLPPGAIPAAFGLGVGDYSWIGERFLQPNTPSVLLSYAEVLFLGAEAAARGWISGSASALCEQGIAASMAQYDIGAAASSAFIAANPCTGLQDILTQKWVALYLLGPESYADVRRTGIPNLPLPAEAVINQLPARLPYPANEDLYNPNFAEYANVDYTVPLWWMP